MTKEIHNLKITPKNFEDVRDRRMSFQIRKCDRDYKVNDFLYLQEYDEWDCGFTGKTIPCRVTHILREDEGLQEGFVLLNIDVIKLLIHDGLKYKYNV